MKEIELNYYSSSQLWDELDQTADAVSVATEEGIEAKGPYDLADLYAVAYNLKEKLEDLLDMIEPED